MKANGKTDSVTVAIIEDAVIPFGFDARSRWR